MTLHESHSKTRHDDNVAFLTGDETCPVCSRVLHAALASLSQLDEDVARLIRANAPGAEDIDDVCLRCVQLFERAKDQIIAEAAVQKDGSHVLSTPLRLDADERFTGKGVTIAFLDSGFYPHVDLTTPINRILAYRNLLDGDGDMSSLLQPDVASWHGMMTSVVAAGNGSLSNGFYRGLAPDADVVLVKLANNGPEYSRRPTLGAREP
jgi:serine protease AprX